MEWFESLFFEVGRKIKAVAKWTFIVTFFVMVIGGVLAMLGTLFDEDTLPFVLVIPIGVFVALCGVLFSSWLLYGFGTLIEKAETEERPVRRIDYPTDGIYKCESCGHVMNSNERHCTNCGHVVGSAEKSDSPTKMHWTCTCGMKNAKFTSICISCGKPRPGDGYQKCPSCGAMVRAGESCPLCEK